jgi:hypothetical protein
VGLQVFTFLAGDTGTGSILNTSPVVGDPLPQAKKLEIFPGAVSPLPSGTRWALHAVIRNLR